MTELRAIEGGLSRAARFEALLRPHYPALYRVAYRLTRSSYDAEDLVQEVCVRAYPRLEELESLERPRAWMLRVLQRLYIDQMRRYENNHVQSIDSADPRAWVSSTAGPFDDAERAANEERLVRAWAHLDKRQQVLLALHDVEGYTLAELEDITGCKQGTLKSRLSRARVRLGHLLERDANVRQFRRRSGAAG